MRAVNLVQYVQTVNRPIKCNEEGGTTVTN